MIAVSAKLQLINKEITNFAVINAKILYRFQINTLKYVLIPVKATIFIKIQFLNVFLVKPTIN